MDFAGILTALLRAIGIPSRMATGTYYQAYPRWNFHVWNEVWFKIPLEGTDNWYVFDATDYDGDEYGSAPGYTDSRKDYYSLDLNGDGTPDGQPLNIWVGNIAGTDKEEVTTFYT
jgi:transglutaminase-like putative cysteine protease